MRGAARKWKERERMSPAEFINLIKKPPGIVLAIPGPRPKAIIKEIMMRAAKEAEPPWSKQEIKEVMEALGLRPGYD